jgi:hypothetical protein
MRSDANRSNRFPLNAQTARPPISRYVTISALPRIATRAGRRCAAGRAFIRYCASDAASDEFMGCEGTANNSHSGNFPASVYATFAAGYGSSRSTAFAYPGKTTSLQMSIPAGSDGDDHGDGTGVGKGLYGVKVNFPTLLVAGQTVHAQVRIYRVERVARDPKTERSCVTGPEPFAVDLDSLALRRPLGPQRRSVISREGCNPR